MKKTHRRTRSLRLNKETLKQLSSDQIALVGGAGPSDNYVSFCVCPSKSLCWSIGDIC
jgi:hypothetical protein